VGFRKPVVRCESQIGQGHSVYEVAKTRKHCAAAKDAIRVRSVIGLSQLVAT